MKRKSVIILFAVLAAVMVAAIAVTAYIGTLHGRFSVAADGQTVTEKVDISGLTPGVPVVTKYDVEASSGLEFSVSFDLGNESILFDHLDITVDIDGETVLSGALRECAGGASRIVKGDFTLSITYLLDSSADNSVMGAEAELTVIYGLGRG